MKKGHKQVTFKPYNMGQGMLLPPHLAEMIPEDHLVRVVNRIIEEMDLEPLMQKYAGGGTSSYHPRMMLKVLVYGYCEQIYTSRKIAKALRENVNFMWLSGMSQPDFRTINRFRGKTMKGVIQEVFGAVLEILIEEGYVKLENYFVDGTTVEANANRHKVVWAKSVQKRKEKMQEKIQELLEEIERVNNAENAEYGDKDLEELGGAGGLDAEKLKQKIAELNRRLKEQPEDKKLKKAVKQMQENYLPRQERYEEQERKLAGRNSYSKTDEDASCMRVKEDRGVEKPAPKPAYNIQVGTENQFVVGFSIHGRAGDTHWLIPHLEQVKGNLQTIARRNPSLIPADEQRSSLLPKNMVADAGYGSEENYAYLEEHHLGNYVKYNTFHRQQIKHRKPELIEQERFRSENFPYDPQKDQFTCPAHQPLTFRQIRSKRTDNGYLTERRIYECDACSTCPLKPNCTQAQGNRRIQFTPRLQRFRDQARQNLLSEQGRALRSKRSIEVETVFGDEKQNMHFRRFLLRGSEKVEIEFGLISIAHNMRKLAVS